MTTTKIAKAERRVVRSAMRLHAHKPRHGFGEQYEEHRGYLTGQLHRACDALDKARIRASSTGKS